MSSQEDTLSEIVFTTKQLSECLELSTRRIQQLAEEGVLVRAQRGKYNAIESMKNYIRFLEERDAGNTGEVDYYHEKALHEKAKREKAEIEVAALKGKMHKSEDVAAVMNDMVASCRAKMLSLPTKVAPMVVGKNNVAVVRDLISREVKEALNELADYNREIFLAQSEELAEGDEE